MNYGFHDFLFCLLWETKEMCVELKLGWFILLYGQVKMLPPFGQFGEGGSLHSQRCQKASQQGGDAWGLGGHRWKSQDLYIGLHVPNPTYAIELYVLTPLTEMLLQSKWRLKESLVFLPTIKLNHTNTRAY